MFDQRWTDFNCEMNTVAAHNVCRKNNCYCLSSFDFDKVKLTVFVWKGRIRDIEMRLVGGIHT